MILSIRWALHMFVSRIFFGSATLNQDGDGLSSRYPSSLLDGSNPLASRQTVTRIRPEGYSVILEPDSRAEHWLHLLLLR